MSALQEAMVAFEAEKLIRSAEPVGRVRLVLATYDGRSGQELRALASRLQTQPGIVTALAGQNGGQINLAVSCAGDTGINARELLQRQLLPMGGRGGGSDQLAQGGASVDDGRMESFVAGTRDLVLELQQGRPS